MWATDGMLSKPSLASLLPLLHCQIQEALSVSGHPFLVTRLQPSVFHKQWTVHCEKCPGKKGPDIRQSFENQPQLKKSYLYQINNLHQDNYKDLIQGFNIIIIIFKLCKI